MSSAVRRLIAEVESDRKALRHHLDVLDRLLLTPRADEGTLAQAAWALHHAYGTVESILERVARVIEQSVPQGADFHRALLDAAGLRIEAVRPALLGRETVLGLHDLRTAALRPLLDADLDRLETWLSEVAAALEHP